ncbi:hypothetical protein, partial [Xanthomonas phaseoli]|uniref:hypothetical protein n=1 Tax=Xanthomonas phaseoli TaxID=1985254 RepID=UPI003F1EA5E0
ATLPPLRVVIALSEKKRQLIQCSTLVRANHPPSSLHVFWTFDFAASDKPPRRQLFRSARFLPPLLIRRLQEGREEAPASTAEATINI